MSTLQSLLYHARQVLRLSPVGGATDGQLLDRFRGGDDVAFELLVWRHGPMVLSVCRRVLADEHAAEDAFQAVFLALAQKSAAIGHGDAVGAWLYRVAYRTALRARARGARQARREAAAGQARAQRIVPEPAAGLANDELRPLLDAEIAHLPAEYRTAFVLCHLEGKTNEEAARELGCPIGTIQSRLSRARARLRARLRKRDLGPDCIPFIFFIRRPQAPPELPPALVRAAIRTALPARPDMVAPPRRRRVWLGRAALAMLAVTALTVLGTLAYAGLTGANIPDQTPPHPTTDPAGPTYTGACHEAPAATP
jgi:RNA polymerase sigma factor (sigma-70 family)